MLKNRFSVYGLCAALLFVPTVSCAGDVEEMLQKLQQRIEALEKKNAELEQKNIELEKMMKQRPSAAPVAEGQLVDRIKALEEKNAKLEATIEEEHKATDEMRQDVMSYKKHARMIEKFAGIEIGGDINFTVQGTKNNDDNKPTGSNRGDKADASYSAGLHASVPFGETGQVFLRANIGQGEGVTRWLPDTLSGPNADLEHDDSRIRLVEAWYQAHIHLPWGSPHEESKQSLFLNIGKLDPTAFFDGNAIANNENDQFMADIFVNNTTIGWGGDENGYGPGVRLAYVNEQREDLAWNLSIGLFEGNSDEDGTFQDTFDRPFAIAEMGMTKKYGELEGNYRVYGWLNKGKHTEWKDSSKDNEENIGWGISVDQQVAKDITLFGRYGMQDKKVSTFDRTFSIGGQTMGAKWNRPNDVLAVAYGFSSPSHDFKKVAETHPDYGYKVRESEHYMEAYYKIQVNDQLSITPDIQYVVNPGGDDEKDDFLIYGLRMFLTF